jgi:hypothetical protein
MRSSKAPPVSWSRAGDRGELYALLPWAYWRGRQLAALWTVLWFCGLIAASGPHLVHHFTALPRPADQHTPADEPRPLDCVVFSLMQHTPVAEGILNPVRPENLKLFINLTFFDFVLMLDQRTPPSSDTPW